MWLAGCVRQNHRQWYLSGFINIHHIGVMREGWLEAPDGREVRRYHRNPESSGRWPEIWIDSGLPIKDEPALLKRRRAVPRDAAAIEWKGLQNAGWRQVPRQW